MALPPKGPNIVGLGVAYPHLTLLMGLPKGLKIEAKGQNWGGFLGMVQQIPYQPAVGLWSTVSSPTLFLVM